MNTVEVNQILAELAERHDGLISVALAEAAGITRAQLHRRVQRGVLVQVDERVFRVAGAPMTWHAKALHAVWSHGPDGLLSHRCSALLWRLDGIERAPFEVLTPRWRRHQKRPGIVVHETKTLRPIDAAVRDRIPCTSVVRTLLDLTAVVPERRADQAIEDALRRRLCTVGQLADRFAQIARRGRPGVVVARRLLEKRGIDYVATMSEFERRVSDLAEGAGLPRPTRQVAVRLAGTVVYIDLGWPELMLGVECDGLEFHGGAVTLPWEDDRQNELVLLGWFILRFTWKQLVESPQVVLGQIRAAVDRQQRMLRRAA